MDNPKIEYYRNGNIESENWHENGQLHRHNGPAKIVYHKHEIIKYERWYINGKLHRYNGPAIIYYKKTKIINKYWFINGKEINPPYDNYPLTKEQIVEMKLTYG